MGTLFKGLKVSGPFPFRILHVPISDPTSCLTAASPHRPFLPQTQPLPLHAYPHSVTPDTLQTSRSPSLGWREQLLPYPEVRGTEQADLRKASAPPAFPQSPTVDRAGICQGESRDQGGETSQGFQEPFANPPSLFTIFLIFATFPSHVDYCDGFFFLFVCFLFVFCDM